MTQQKVNLNADMGEGFGAYDIGDDSRLLSIIGSASVACGMHAGDPNVMHRVIGAARDSGVSIGAHPGFNDLWGFGRRRIDMRPHDLELLVAYQIGALQGIAAYFGLTVTHMKPHGALNNMAAEDIDYALAIGRAVRAVDPAIVYVALSGSEMVRAAEQLSLPVAHEGFVDRLYEDDGNLTSRRIPGALIHDPILAAERTVEMVTEQVVISRNGARIPRRLDTLCIHGDEPTACLVGEAVRSALEKADVQLVTLPEMMA
jgi:UPF0271 protein